MMTLREYLQDPCGSLSVPYWKWKTISLPEDMKIYHDRDFVPEKGYHDTVYFRLRHDLRDLPESVSGVHQARTSDFAAMADIICRCYPGIRFDAASLEALTRNAVYAPKLWLVAEAEGEIAGCLIADLDRDAREGILEWVQVLPRFRRRGLGRALVLEALRRMDGDFATVSGCEPTAECLYRACGFTGQDRWHILRKE